MITNDDTESDARRVFNTRLAKVRADRINMQQNVEELFSAFMEMWKIHPSRFMEIGSLNGGSLYILAGACAPGAVIACFDIKRVTKRQAILDDLRREGFLTYEQIGDSGSMQTLDRFKKMFPRGLDALHIDGDHGKPNCFLDFEWYGTSVRNGGLVLIHDIATKFECAEAWLELRHRYRHAEYKNGGQGMGVLFV